MKEIKGGLFKFNLILKSPDSKHRCLAVGLSPFREFFDTGFTSALYRKIRVVGFKILVKTLKHLTAVFDSLNSHDKNQPCHC